MYRDDYARAGIRMLPVVEPDGKSTSRQIILYATTLIPISLLPVMLGMSGTIYLVGALVLGLWFLYTGVRVAFDRTNVRARHVLLASVIYLPMIYGLMVFDRLLCKCVLRLLTVCLLLAACGTETSAGYWRRAAVSAHRSAWADLLVEFRARRSRLGSGFRLHQLRGAVSAHEFAHAASAEQRRTRL